MTQIITRYFDDAESARSARHELIHRRRFSVRIVDLYESADGLADQLIDGHVTPDTARAYQDRMSGAAGAVLLVQAGYKPLGVARIARDVAASYGGVAIPELNEAVYVKEERQPLLSILPSHPRILTKVRDPNSTNYYMADWPIPLISRRVPSDTSLLPHDARMASQPIPHLLPGDKRYGRFPFDLLIPGHKFMAKFPFGHIVPGHKKMAGFPIGHLVPGNKFMAKFPIAHLIPGHKFMAKFPIAHLVPGHKNMAKFPFGHIVPGHKYMANWSFPHSKSEGS